MDGESVISSTTSSVTSNELSGSESNLPSKENSPQAVSQVDFLICN